MEEINWIPLDSDFTGALQFCKTILNGNENSEPSECCVHWKGNILESVRAAYVIQNPLETSLPDNVEIFIPLSIIDLFFAYHFDAVAITATKIHWRQSYGRVFSHTRIIVKNYPDTSEFSAVLASD